MNSKNIPLMYEGSAKNVFGTPGDKEFQFEFGDSYSIFDWGKMPDEIPGKGASNKFFTTLFYNMFESSKTWRGFSVPGGVLYSTSGEHLERLKKCGLTTHLLSSDELSGNRIRVKAVDVKHPRLVAGGTKRWDYYQYKKRVVNTLVPLEVIFRFEIVEGSSLLERCCDSSYMSDLLAVKDIEVGDKYARPIIEFSTKLEESDRFLSYEEAREISGMSEGEFEKLYYNTFWASLLLKKQFSDVDINLIDGKFEFAFIDSKDADRDFMLVDSIGPDELRLEASGKILSKELLRNYYRDSKWYQGVKKAKQIANDRGSVHWKEICKSELGVKPKHLPQSIIGECSSVYSLPHSRLKECFLPELNIVVLGKGGREHVIGKKMLESSLVSSVTVIPGNSGMNRYDDISTMPEIEISDHKTIIEEVRKIAPDFVFVGPEDLLEAGIVSKLEELGIKCIGPTADAVKLESSKIYAKEIMNKYGIPTAKYVVGVGYDDTIKKLEEFDSTNGVVIKCDELAAGKGVVVAKDLGEAKMAVYNFSKNSNCPVKSSCFVIEEKLVGKELSFFVLCDGSNYVRVGAAHDYKRAIEGDQGPNTGGMGGFSANPKNSEKLYREIETTVVEPLLKGMQKEGSPFKGVLFIGLMVKGDKFSVLEFNVRFGDPEAQILLPLIENDFGKICHDLVMGRLENSSVVLSSKRAVHVVLASKGYPDITGEGMELGKELSIGPLISDEVDIYFSGVSSSQNQLVNSGGRVIGVTAVADSLPNAKSYAYEMMEQIKLEGGYYRRDVAGGELL